jgi:hypothetical protein
MPRSKKLAVAEKVYMSCSLVATVLIMVILTIIIFPEIAHLLLRN